MTDLGHKVGVMEFDGTNGGGGSGKVKNIYARGADDGLWLGICLMSSFVLMALSLKFPLLNLGALALMLSVPFLTYFFLRRTHMAAYGLVSFSGLWMQGITMFACGSLLLGLASFVYLRWLDPGFMVRALQMGIDYYSELPSESGQVLADELRMIADSGAMPAPSMIVMVWMWMTMFSGSVLSLIVAGLVKAQKVRRR